MTSIDPETKKLAAIVYGEASTLCNKDEMDGIAFAVANRCRAWGGKTVNELLFADPNYTYAIKGDCKRFELLINASESNIIRHAEMSIALDAAKRALKNEGADPSNGAYWWDGLDFRTNFQKHPKVKDGFRFSDPKHNIFSVPEKQVDITIYWKVKNKLTGEEVNSKVRGKYSCIWESTAAYGQTIFWKHDIDYLKATGGKAYR